MNVLPASVEQAFALPEKGYGRVRRPSKRAASSFQVDKVTPPAALGEKKSNASSSRSNCC